VYESVKSRPFVSRLMRRESARLARVRRAVAVAAHDFSDVWPALCEVQVHGGRRIVGVPTFQLVVGSQMFVIRDSGHAHLVVRVAHALQYSVTRGESRWPHVPGVGALSAAVVDGCAVWARSDGTEFCEIGHLFPERPGNASPSGFGA
jgi:hypothetical protein